MDSTKYIPGYGPRSPKIVFVGEAPSYDEVNTGKGFTGPSGRELDSLCRDAGINRNDCWITNVSKYYVPPGPKKGRQIPFQTRAHNAGINLDNQISELRTELQQLNPNVVVPLGSTALWALTGKSKISELRGSIIHGMGFKVVGTYHPAHLLHQGTGGEIKGYWNRLVMVFDLKRALEQSKFPELRLPHRNLQICRNSGQLYDFIQRYTKSKGTSRPNLSIDIEAQKCIPICIGLAFNEYEGLTVPLWNDVGSNSISSIPDADLVNLWMLLSNLFIDINIDKTGQNFGYDRDKIRRLGFTLDRLNSDTMLKSFAINPELPKNLAFNTSIYTEEPYYKDEGMYEGSTSDLLIGCARDACVTWEIDTKMESNLEELRLKPYFEQFLMPLHELYLGIENEGFKISTENRESLLKKYIEWDEKINYELFQICGATINTSSPKQVSSLLYDNWKIPSRAGTGEEVLTQLLNNTVKKKEHRRGIELILEDRRVKKTISTYLMANADYDGRMRTSYFICLETGRSSTTNQAPPTRPKVDILGKGRKKDMEELGIAFQTITKHGDVGGDVREMYVVDEGEVFLQADSSQAEARVIFLLANDEQALIDIDEHDYHALTASWFFGGCENDYSKKVLGYESPIRFAGKTLRHAGHLGASKRRASIEVNTQARKNKINYTISEADSGKALDIFHRKQPKIQKVFHFEVIAALEKKRTLYAPLPFGIDAPIGGRRQFFERWNEDLFRQAFSYIPQRTVSENTKAAAVRIKLRAPWIRILVEAHDALLCSVPINRKLEAAQIIKEEFERPINFSVCSLPRRDLIIPCEIEEGVDYKNLSKFKFLVEAA